MIRIAGRQSQVMSNWQSYTRQTTQKIKLKRTKKKMSKKKISPHRQRGVRVRMCVAFCSSTAKRLLHWVCHSNKTPKSLILYRFVPLQFHRSKPATFHVLTAFSCCSFCRGAAPFCQRCWSLFGLAVWMPRQKRSAAQTTRLNVIGHQELPAADARDLFDVRHSPVDR